jgi:uncharacterized caspase-like protein
MDTQQALQRARELLIWMGPRVAGGALAKAGEDTADQASQMVGRAWQLFQGWLASDADAADDLRKLEKQPESASRQLIVAEALARIVARDTAMAAELEALAHALENHTRATLGRSHQITVSGSAQVGQAIAGDVHGGLTVGPIDFSKQTIVATPGGATSMPAASSAAPAARPVLPTTLSADGKHFSYGHALLIGVGNYQSAGLSITTTVADAKHLGALLCDPLVAGYPANQVRVLVDADATRAGILGALDAFAQQLAAAPRATALIFFAGHGKQNDSEYYLLPHDYTPIDIGGTAISAQVFHEKIAMIRQRVQKLIVLLNCCHSGGIGDLVLDAAANLIASDTPPVDFYQPLIAGSGQVVISAARPGQKAGAVAPATPSHTVFGARLLDALRGQAPGDTPAIGVFELFSYLSAHVPVDAKQIRYKNAPLAQEPLLYGHQLDQNIAVALRPNWQGGTLDADFAAIMEEFAQAEIELARYPSQAQAPETLLRRRDAAFARLEAATSALL